MNKNKRTFYFVILLILSLNNIILADSVDLHPQVKDWMIVNNARNNWQDVQLHVITLVGKKGDLQGKVDLAKHAQGDNREDYRDEIIGILRSLSIDPVNIASNAATQVTLIVADIIDSISLNKAVNISIFLWLCVVVTSPKYT